ncbi:flagellar biosynthetic protein FliO [Solibacillus sp. FSL H8-0538]|uniref:flagellar biosynthetic protein FliO n=1 Tax=Solibacillus sp. FSL H8-0538 TaxID=2921400 RepID=UPI0030F85BCC
MHVKKSLRVGMVFALLVVIALFVPSQSSVFASANNGMISDECLKNPNQCQESNITDAEAEQPESASVSIGPWEYIKILLSLVFVLALLIMVLKFLNKRNLNYQQNSIVRNIGGLSVGAQKSVQLLHIGNSLYVVGVGEDVRLLKEIASPEEVEQILNYYNDKQGNASTSPYIVELFSKFKSNKDVSENPKFNTMFNERINEIKRERSDELERWKEQENDKQ